MDNVYIDGRKAAFASLGDVLILGLGKAAVPLPNTASIFSAPAFRA